MGILTAEQNANHNTTMDQLLQVISAIPNVIFHVAAILSSGVFVFWVWYWFTNDLRWWRAGGDPGNLPPLGVLLLAAGWLLLAFFFIILQRRINRRKQT